MNFHAIPLLPSPGAPAPPDVRSLVAHRADGGARLALAGTTEPRTVVTITWPDGHRSSVAANSSGDWQAQAPVPQPCGTLRITATDEQGHISIPRLSRYEGHEGP